MALTDTGIKQLKHKGASNGEKYSDGGGMYLHVTATGKYWRMNYRHLAKQKTLALGVYPAVSLAKARQRREKARELLADNQDPSVAKQEERQAQLEAAANTFEHMAREWLDKTRTKRATVTIRRATLSSTSLALMLAIGNLPMEARGIHESAHRIVQICSQVFRYAVSAGVIERDVTSDLRGALVEVKATHYAAIVEPKLVGQLLRSIHAYAGHPCAIAGLKLSPLLFVRPGELRAAEWAEIDLDLGVWRIPAARMKMNVEHVVPLSTQAVDILRELKSFSGHGRYVFPSIRTGERCMSENTINAALRGMGYAKEVMTAHGFRAMARTIMDEVLEERVDLIEHQLAHLVRDPNGTAYNRTAHLPARRLMMQRWAEYLDKLRVGANVVVLRAA